MSPGLRVLAVGAQCLVQDRGRRGWAHLGVPRAGALDAPAAALANRLVGNDADDALLEVLLGGLVLQATAPRWVAVTGAPAPAVVDGRAVGHGTPVRLRAGSRLSLGTPPRGLRSYVAVAGGLAVAPVLGSRSTDVLAGVGPPAVVPGAWLPVGPPRGAPVAVDVPARGATGPLRLHPGPHVARLGGLAALTTPTWTVRAESDRVGVRLAGPDLGRDGAGEVPSAGLVLGAVQLPPDGRPVVFLADHPTTGGYPVVAVVDPADVHRCAQVRPGGTLRFRA